jgi:hypothetical protein
MFGIPSPIIFAVGGALALALLVGGTWVKATNVANDAWAAKIVVETEKVRAAQAARNRKTEEDLRVLVDVQTKARERAEQQSEELRNALAADQTDTTITVGPELDLVFCRAVGGGRSPGPCVDPGG